MQRGNIAQTARELGLSANILPGGKRPFDREPGNPFPGNGTQETRRWHTTSRIAQWKRWQLDREAAFMRSNSDAIEPVLLERTGHTEAELRSYLQD